MADSTFEALNQIPGLVSSLNKILIGGEDESVTINGTTKPTLANAIKAATESAEYYAENAFSYSALAQTSKAAAETAQAVAQAVAVGLVNGGIVGKATLAALDADLAYDAGMVGLVTNDSTAGNNGFYLKSGDSGAGSWVQSSYDRVSVVEEATAANEATISLQQEQLLTSNRNGRTEPFSTDTLISQTAEYKYTANGVYSVRVWQVQQDILADKIINTISIPVVRDLFNDTTFTQSVLVRIAKNDMWIVEHTITVEELSAYNLLNSASDADEFDYFIEFPDIKFSAGDRLYVGWQCGSDDLMSMVYGPSVTPTGEGTERKILSTITVGALEVLSDPPEITNITSWNMRLRSYYRRYSVDAEVIVKQNLNSRFPKKIYTIQNDAITGSNFSGRRTAIPLFIDHCFHGVSQEYDISFAGSGADHTVFFSPEDSDDGATITHDDTETYSHTVDIFGGTYFDDTSFTIEQKSTKESVGKTTMPRILCIGDSVTNGYRADMNVSSDGPQPYWACIKNEFERAKIENGDNSVEHNCLMLGHYASQSWSLTYGGVVGRALQAFAEGYGGWASPDHLHYSRNWTSNFSQGFWDLLGLGDGSGTDYVGSNEQKYAFSTTPEGAFSPTNTQAFIDYINSQLGESVTTYADAVTALEVAQESPVNPFYDKDTAAAGVCGFSLSKYLERYKTLSNDGTTRLIAGSTAGSEVTDATAWDICLPTHIILQHSHNDGNAPWIAANYRVWTDAIKAEYSANGWGSVNIAISIIDHTGTYFPSRYPDFDIDSVALWNHDSGHTKFYDNFGRVLDEFWVDSANEDTERVFILPSGHVQPTAWASPFREIPLPGADKTGLNSMIYKKMNGGSPDWHPNGIAHRAWGLEMYAWIKYTLSL